MRLRPTFASLALALIVQAALLIDADRATAQDNSPAAASRSQARGGKIIRTSSRSRIDTADRLAAYQDAAIDAPAVPQLSDGPSAPGNYIPSADTLIEGGSFGGGCASGACDSGCATGNCGGGSLLGLGASFSGGCSSCDGGGCSSCGDCGGGCDGFLCSYLDCMQITDMFVPPMAQANGFFFDGWIDHGYTANPDDPDNNFNLPVTFNDRANEYTVNQVYLSFGREVGNNCGYWDIGGRVDAMYGTDYFFVESLGLELHQDGTPHWNSSQGPRRRVRNGSSTDASVYGVALPQAYAELYAPIGSGVRMKVGHFYTILGYESVMSPENFFYSHSYTQQYGEPFTHTGMLFSYDWTNCWSISAGITRGWDNWENPADEYSFLGGITWTSPTKRTSVSAAVHGGDEQGNNRTVYSIVFRHRIHRCLTWVVQHDGGHEDFAGEQNKGADWFTASNYLYWSLTPKLDMGLRYEFFHDNDNSRVFAFPSRLNENTDYHAWTWGLNYKACRNLMIRPELRADYSTVKPLGQGGVFNDFTEQAQFTMGIDFISRF